MPAEPQLPDRPLVHHTPPQGWMNDPNGLVHHDRQWHLCYQHQPDALVWGPMHWGHAVSRDLLTWEHLPVALEPDEQGAIFSGSAVLDREGRSGYGPEALLAFFTYHRDGDRGQALAGSVDGGRTWTKHAANPVLPAPADSTVFRDPRVLRYRDPSGGAWWVMVVAAGDAVRFHRSDDLLRWTHTGTLGGLTDGGLGTVETPELVELDVDGGPERAWMLAFGHDTGGPHGGSATRYLVGGFDGACFTPLHGTDGVRWADQGADFYAAQSWTDAPEGRCLWIGWLSNWAYAASVPATSWRGMMSLPRELRLVRDTTGVPVLAQQPVQELDAARHRLVELHEPDLEVARAALAEVAGPCLDVRLEIEVPSEAAGVLDLGVHVPRDAPAASGAGSRVRYEVGSRQLVVDRSHAGAALPPAAPTVLRSTPLEPGEELDLRIVADTSSVEVFAARGTTVLSAQVLPPEATRVRLDQLPAGARILHLDIGEIVVR